MQVKRILLVRDLTPRRPAVAPKLNCALSRGRWGAVLDGFEAGLRDPEFGLAQRAPEPPVLAAEPPGVGREAEALVQS